MDGNSNTVSTEFTRTRDSLQRLPVCALSVEFQILEIFKGEIIGEIERFYGAVK